VSGSKIRIILYGLLIWFIPALAAMMAWDSNTNLPRIGYPWFDAMMAAVWSLNFIVVAFFYFKGVTGDYVKQGLIVGISWYVLCVLLDLVLLVGLFKTDINTWYPGILSYLNNFFVAAGIGYILNKKK
jgi:hypothetical protein